MIEITSDAIERVGTLLADVPKGAERVFASAMNRGISRVKTQAIKQVKTVYAVNGAALTKATRINITKASTGNLAGFVSFWRENTAVQIQSNADEARNWKAGAGSS